MNGSAYRLGCAAVAAPVADEQFANGGALFKHRIEASTSMLQRHAKGAVLLCEKVKKGTPEGAATKKMLAGCSANPRGRRRTWKTRPMPARYNGLASHRLTCHLFIIIQWITSFRERITHCYGSIPVHAAPARNAAIVARFTGLVWTIGPAQ